MVVRDPRPRTLEEVLRQMEDRIRRLEARTSTVVGAGDRAWVVEVDAAGRLVARHVATGAVTIIAAP
ncbi:hypothetical protein [Thermomonospora cellulosilytica]|uniref:Uncharacterized protein n=1 Tax=Thermomonospora cellulosilytica TaxID=1411118 RepID=A0A7W3RB32_9ACTN|nr:hypothetical protein [Thermomonospora cellulosilytica]MBA9005910.1 hypothetical protein [Thermomonospora cellulosilytica]